MKQIFLVISSILFLLILNSCNLDNVDFNKLSDEVNLNPSFVAPLARAEVSGWDLFQTGNKEKGPGGLVNLVYRQNDMIIYKLSDLMNLPTQQRFSPLEKELGEISPGDISISRAISLSELINNLGGSLEDNEANNGLSAIFPAYSYNGSEVQFNMDQINEFTAITMSGGTLDIILENKLKVPVTIKGSIFDIGNNRKIMNFTFANIQPDGSSKNSLNLAGLQLSNKVEIRLSSFDTPGSASEVNINLNDYLKVNFELKGLKISDGNVNIESQVIKGSSGTFDFVFPEPDVKAFTAILKKGIIKIRAINASKITGNINLVLNEIKRNGAAVQSKIPLNGNSISIDLSGAEINFSSDQAKPYNQIPYTYSVEIENSNGYVNYASTDAFILDISLAELDFQSIFGDFGKRKISIDSGDFELEVFNRLGGDFKVANPKLSIIIHNSIGMPAEVGLSMSATSKTGKTESLLRNPATFNIPFPADIHSGITTGTIEYNKQNSNIVEFIALPPNSKISYRGEVDFNKGNEVSALNPNFMGAESTFSVDMSLELPMELQINTLSFKDTSGVSGAGFDKLESADLLINASNGIPVDLDMQLFFIDTISKKQYGTSKTTKILSAAKKDASGEYIPMQSSQTFTLDKSEMDNLRKANGVVFAGTVISPLGENEVVSIFGTSKIKLNVVIKSKLNL